VWFGNFGWGGVNPEPPANGSLSTFAPSGAALSGPNAIFGGPYRPQGMVVDTRGNLSVTSFGNDSVYVFPGGDPNGAVFFRQYDASQPFDIALAPDGSARSATAAARVGAYPSSVAKLSFKDGVLRRHIVRFPGSSLKGLGVDSRGNAGIASLDDNTVYGLRPTAR